METDRISTQVLPVGTRLEEFVIEGVLGSGGFGITYLARDTNLGRQVVIKENLPVQFCFRDTHSLTVAPRHTHGDDMENFRWSLENFTREAATLASLDHPGIVRVLRSFEAFGTAYFVMPFVEGIILDDLLKERQEKGQVFSEEELRGLLERMLDALVHLHGRRIYHRDIKPGNILVTNGGAPVLIDFGSARQRLSERSMTVVESAGYTPFEQLQSRGNVGPWSDLYALGGTFCKAITGNAPPKANDRAFDDPWVPLANRMDLRARYSAGFLEGIDRAMAVRIEDRWEDAGKWLIDLRRHVPIGKPGPAPSPMDHIGLHDPRVMQSTGMPLGRQPGGTGRRVWAMPVLILLGVIIFGVVWAINRQRDLPAREQARQEQSKKEPFAPGENATRQQEEIAKREETVRQNEAARRQREADIARAEDAEKRAAKAEQENLELAAQAKAKEDEAKRQREADVARAKDAERRVAKAALEKQSLAAQAKTKEDAAKQLVCDYLKACDGGDYGVLRRYFSDQVRILDVTGAESVIGDFRAYHLTYPLRTSQIPQGDMNLSWKDNRAVVSGWMDFEHGNGMMKVKGRVKEEYVIEWDSANTPRIASVQRIESRPSMTLFDRDKQKREVEQCLWGYFNAADWSGGNLRIPDQGRFLANTVSYFGRRMTRDEVRANEDDFRRKLRSVEYTGEKATLGGLGTEVINVEVTAMMHKVDLQGQEKRYPAKYRLVIAFRGANSYKPWIEEVDNMK